MKTDCFAYARGLKNNCRALTGDVNCSKCRFYKTKEKYFDEIKKMEIRCGIVRNLRGVIKKVSNT